MKKILILCTIFINSIIVTKAQYSPGALAGRIGRAWSGEGASELANEAISGFISAANTVGTSATAGAEFGGSAATLASNECTPNFSDDVNARMNFLCAPQSECQSCYDQARQNMNFFRRQLERLHCIYINTKKFTTDAIAFGDNASGIHAMTGIV